ncbi:hypothetical protein ACFO4E_16060 [Nocardiopsis mangrovi]|uniref:Uncharacterized protein n=1 Tax=Nocardiopsis mangrovi TaxID=1179818 RepID=A0ABV9DYG7_9ACTN
MAAMCAEGGRSGTSPHDIPAQGGDRVPAGGGSAGGNRRRRPAGLSIPDVPPADVLDTVENDRLVSCLADTLIAPAGV